MAQPFQTDLKVLPVPSSANTKLTLSLTETGDIQVVTGNEKLVEQLTRSIVNENALGTLLNSPVSTRQITTLVTLILRNFKQWQINDTKRSDASMNGFSIYRKASGIDDTFTKITASPVTYKFVDTTVTNEREYEYAIAKNYKNVFESAFLEKLSVLPTAFVSKKQTVIGDAVVAIPDSRQVTFYVDYNRYFKASELLDEVISIDVQQSETEPRAYVVHVLMRDLLGNKLSIAAQKFSLGI